MPTLTSGLLSQLVTCLHVQHNAVIDFMLLPLRNTFSHPHNVPDFLLPPFQAAIKGCIIELLLKCCVTELHFLLTEDLK
jgi:hypothetical protein